MALARTYAMALAGVQGHVVEIEADIENGLVGLLLVGLPDTALREARDRIRSAVVNSQQSWPQRRITVGLSPASLPKRGSGFDLGIAIAILSAAGVVPEEGLAGTVFLGELGLDGRIRPVPGVLPSIAAAAGAGFGRAVVPVPNAAEAALVPSVRVISAGALGELIEWLRFGDPDASGLGVQVLDSGAGIAVPVPADADSGQGRDLADVAGQPVARRAAEICAAGGHHMLLLGPPGSGKPTLPGRCGDALRLPEGLRLLGDVADLQAGGDDRRNDLPEGPLPFGGSAGRVGVVLVAASEVAAIGPDAGFVAANGPVVMTERVDVFTLPGRSFELPVMGTFEISDGKIKAWPRSPWRNSLPLRSGIPIALRLPHR